MLPDTFFQISIVNSTLIISFKFNIENCYLLLQVLMLFCFYSLQDTLDQFVLFKLPDVVSIGNQPEEGKSHY